MKVCTFEGCEKRAITRGLCNGHYGQHYRREQLRPLNPVRRVSDVEFFWAHVQKNSADCWSWSGSLNATGYAMFRRHRAHRFSYELHKGKIPDGLQVDHQCRNRTCTNPDHLVAVSSKENNENLGIRADNKTGARGVWFDKRTKKYVAAATNRGIQHWGGRHDTAEAAARAARNLRMVLFTNNVGDRGDGDE